MVNVPDSDAAIWASARRKFLGSAAAVAGVVSFPVAAGAFSAVEPDAKLLEQYRNACGARLRVHDSLVQEVRGFLAAKDGPEIPEERVQAALKTVACPFCGCSLDKAPRTGA